VLRLLDAEAPEQNRAVLGREREDAIPLVGDPLRRGCRPESRAALGREADREHAAVFAGERLLE